MEDNYSDSDHVLNALFQPGSVLSTSPVLTHWILTTYSSGNRLTIAAFPNRDDGLLDTQG